MPGAFVPFPNPGLLPTKPPPEAGERILIAVDGYPPYKGERKSLRNPTNPLYHRFTDLRNAATRVMNGRCWTDKDVELRVKLFFPNKTWPDKLIDDYELFYVSGIMDTLDGSHGMSFTHLPIVIQDDRQAHLMSWTVEDSPSPHYEVDITFMASSRF